MGQLVRLERVSGYGWHVWLFDRVRLCSPGALTPMWPRVYRGTDEFCNATICLHAWPVGGVDVWWRRKQRTEADGPCDACQDDEQLSSVIAAASDDSPSSRVLRASMERRREQIERDAR